MQYKKYFYGVIGVLLGGIFLYFFLFPFVHENNEHEEGLPRLLSPVNGCIKNPDFFVKEGILQSVAIDLTQTGFTGVRIKYNYAGRDVFQMDSWRAYGHFSNYARDHVGNILLTPMPFVSIKDDTFALQKNIYQINTETGELSVFMILDDVVATAENPFGIISLAYNCTDHSLFVSAIDQSDFENENGRIYHIDIATKEIIDVYHGVDALSLAVGKSEDGGTHLLYGSARTATIYGLRVEDNGVFKEAPYILSQIPDRTKRVHRLRSLVGGIIEAKAIDFEYALTATSDVIRKIYHIQPQSDRDNGIVIWVSNLVR